MTSPPVTFTINDLHDEPLLALFDRFPLMDLLAKVDQVCRRWNRIRALALARRRSITVLVNDPKLGQIERSCFNVPYLDQVNLPREHHLSSPQIEFCLLRHSFLKLFELTQDKANWLVVTFPRIRTLRLVASVDVISHVTYLLNQWHTKLVTLKLWLGGGGQVRAVTDQFLAAINSLPVIERLVIEMAHQSLAPHTQYLDQMRHNRYDHDEPEQVHFPQVDLPVLSHLSQLHLSSWDHPNCLVDSLTRYPTQGLQDIRLAIWNDSDNQFPDYQHVPLAVNIRSISQMITVGSEFAHGCDQFRGLSTLSIKLKDTVSMAQLSSQLEPLAHSLLYLKIKFQSYARVSVDGRPPLRLTGLIKADDEQILCPLVGVRILDLWCHALKARHTDLSPLRLPEMFPNVQVAIVVDHWPHGVDCEQFKCNSLFHPERVIECIRRQMQPFQQCASLKTVFYGEYPIVQFSRTELSRVQGQTEMRSQIGRFQGSRSLTVLLGHKYGSTDTEILKRTRFMKHVSPDSCLSSPRLIQVDIDLLFGTFSSTIQHFGVHHNFESDSYGRVERELLLLTKILQHWQHQLTSLALFIHSHVMVEGGAIMHRLLTAINSMANLKKLSLDFYLIRLFGRRSYDETDNFSNSEEPDDTSPAVGDEEEDDQESQGGLDGDMGPLNDDADNECHEQEDNGNYESDDDDYDPEAASTYAEVMPNDDQLDLPVLADLSEFRFHSADHPQILLRSLKEHAQSNQELELVLVATLATNWDQDEKFVLLPEELRSKIYIRPAWY